MTRIWTRQPPRAVCRAMRFLSLAPYIPPRGFRLPRLVQARHVAVRRTHGVVHRTMRFAATVRAVHSWGLSPSPIAAVPWGFPTSCCASFHGVPFARAARQLFTRPFLYVSFLSAFPRDKTFAGASTTTAMGGRQGGGRTAPSRARVFWALLLYPCRRRRGARVTGKALRPRTPPTPPFCRCGFCARHSAPVALARATRCFHRSYYLRALVRPQVLL